MTILAVWGEDSDMVGALGTVSIGTTSTRHRPTYSRNYLVVNAGTSTDGWMAAFPSALSALWLGAQYWNFNSGVNTSFGRIIGLFDGSVERLFIRTDPTKGPNLSTTWQLCKVNAVGTITILQTTVTVFSWGVLQKLDLSVTYGVSGTVKLYAGGVLIIDYTGDLTTDSATTLSGVRFGYASGSGASGVASGWSEMILADEDTRSMALATLTPSGAGNSEVWTGAYTDINESTLSDATAISTLNADELAQFTATPQSIVTGTIGIRGLFVNARASKGMASGPQNIQAVVRTGGADYASSNLPIQPVLGKIANQWTVNPATGLAWTATDLLAAGFNIGLKSIA